MESDLDREALHRDIGAELLAARAMVDQFLADADAVARIADAALLIAGVLAAGGKVVTCGNGGSMSDAMHFAAELSARFRQSRPPLAAIAICDPAYLSAAANDFGYEQVFARQIAALGNPGDLLMAISTSGNSPNVVKAVAAARRVGMRIVALTAGAGGRLAGSADVEIRAPVSANPDRAQEIHVKVLHILAFLVERSLEALPPR